MFRRSLARYRGGRMNNKFSNPALPGPGDILRRTLPNGVIVLARENWTAPSVVVEGYLLAGNLDEPAELMGLASYTASMLSRAVSYTHLRAHETVLDLVCRL